MKPDLKLRDLVIGASAAAALLLLALTAFSALEIVRHRNALSWIEHTHSVLERLAESGLQLKTAELSHQSFLTAGAASSRDEARHAAQSAGENAEALRQMTADNPDQARRAADLAAAAAEIRSSLETGSRRDSPEIERAENLVRTMEAEERTLLAARAASERGSAVFALVALASAIACAGLCAAVMLTLMLRGLAERESLLVELRTHERGLLAANAELDSFAYSVAHDLRAPLRAIDGFTTIIETDYAGSLAPEPLRMFGRIRANTARMSRLIDDLLAFSHLGRQALREDAVDMAALARRAVDDAAAAEPRRDVRATIRGLPACRGDAAMLALAWNNLVSNAYKYTRPRAPAHIEIGGGVRGDDVEYWITDDGVGFDQRYVDKLFNVFSRLHGTTEFEGTGVGLALVRRVVERHGGAVAAEGALDRGATFRFTLTQRRIA